MIDVRVLAANLTEYLDKEIGLLTESILSPLAHEDYLKQVGSVHALQKTKTVLQRELLSLMKKAQ